MHDVGFWESSFLWLDAVAAAVIGALLLSYLGFYVVLTRNAFVSAAVSQLAALGIVLAILLGASETDSVAALVIGGQRPEDATPLLVGTAFGILGTALFALPRGSRRVSTDALLAIAVIAASSSTLVCARYLTTDYQHVQAALFGDAVVASRDELIVLFATAIGVGLLHLFFRDRFLLVVFDRNSGRAQGMATGPWSLLLGLTVGLSIAVVTRSLGALPAFAYTVVPATGALLLTSKLPTALWIAAGVAVVSATVGYYLSFVLDLPTGPTMVTVTLLPLLPAAVLALVRRA